MPRSTGSVRSRIGSATTVEEIVHSLAKRGCFDLSSSINLGACSEFPCTGGGYCDVYRGALHDGTSIAIKTLRIYNGAEAEQDSNSRKVLKRAARELYHWSKLQHPNVLPLMGLAVFRGQMSMISKWMENGSLALFLRLNQDANRPTICADICEGLCYIHANGVVHGDLKGANVMVSPDGTAMIADFGNTQLKDFTLRFSTTAKSGYSIRWAAPELLLEDSGPQVSKEADVYAYGMTVLEVLTGKVPYEGISDTRILILVAVEQKVPDRPNVDMPGDLWNLLKSCWNREPSKRLKIARVREGLQGLSWFPSNPQLTTGTTPDHTQRKSGGSVEGPKQVGGSVTSIGEGPAIFGEGPTPIGKGPSRIGEGPLCIDEEPSSHYTSNSPTTSDDTDSIPSERRWRYYATTPVTPDEDEEKEEETKRDVRSASDPPFDPMAPRTPEHYGRPLSVIPEASPEYQPPSLPFDPMVPRTPPHYGRPLSVISEALPEHQPLPLPSHRAGSQPTTPCTLLVFPNSSSDSDSSISSDPSFDFMIPRTPEHYGRPLSVIPEFEASSEYQLLPPAFDPMAPRTPPHYGRPLSVIPEASPEYQPPPLPFDPMVPRTPPHYGRPLSVIPEAPPEYQPPPLTFDPMAPPTPPLYGRPLSVIPEASPEAQPLPLPEAPLPNRHWGRSKYSQHYQQESDDRSAPISAETPITPATSQPRGHDDMRSKKTAPMIKIKSTTRAQVEAFRALQLERQRTPDLSDGEQSAERSSSPSP